MQDILINGESSVINLPSRKSSHKEGKMVLFEGKQRSGKTLGGTIWTYSDYCKGRQIYSNIDLKFPHRPLNFFDLTMRDEAGELEGSTLFIDEMNFYVENRGAMNKLNKEFTMFMLQIKKSDINIYGTTHDLNYLDLRIRSHFDYLIRPKCLPEQRKEDEPPRVLQLDIFNGPNQKKLHRFAKFDPQPYLGLYNTKNRINPFAQTEGVVEQHKAEKKRKAAAIKIHKDQPNKMKIKVGEI